MTRVQRRSVNFAAARTANKRCQNRGGTATTLAPIAPAAVVSYATQIIPYGSGPYNRRPPPIRPIGRRVNFIVDTSHDARAQVRDFASSRGYTAHR
jgi:hypothetical protein